MKPAPGVHGYVQDINGRAWNSLEESYVHVARSFASVSEVCSSRLFRPKLAGCLEVVEAGEAREEDDKEQNPNE